MFKLALVPIIFKIAETAVGNTQQLPPNVQIKVANRFPTMKEKQNNCSECDEGQFRKLPSATFQESKFNVDGSYKIRYNIDDNIEAIVQGKRSEIGDRPVIVSGSFQYTAPDNTLVSVEYVADENGYRPRFKFQTRQPFKKDTSTR
ncbi:Insect cuticle protein [Popillia japonica]|uniref:Insect cuticle protein n=1 Tax=Popillia japonica TaxID=7064 RepID=A0AAW1LDN5_POPJA